MSVGWQERSGDDRTSVGGAAGELKVTDDADVRVRSEAVIRGCVEHVEARFGELVELITERMIDSVVEYRDEGRRREGREKLRSNVEKVVRLFLAVLAERRRLTSEERRHIESIGALRAMEGLPLRAIQEGVDVATDEGQAFLHEALVEAGDDTAALPASRRLGSLVQKFEFDVQRAVETGYRRVGDERIVSEARRREVQLRRLFEGELTGMDVGNTCLAPLASEPRVTVAVLRSADGEVDVESVSTVVGDVFGEAVAGPVSFSVPGTHVGVVATGSPADNARALEWTAVACDAELLVEAADGLADVRRAYALARDVLEVTVPATEPRCVAVRRLMHLPLLFSAPRERLVDYAWRVLGPVFTEVPDHAEKFLSTLLAYYQTPGAQVQQVTYAVGTPVSTVKYHLRRIEEITGLDRTADRLQLELATRIWAHLSRFIALGSSTTPNPTQPISHVDVVGREHQRDGV